MAMISHMIRFIVAGGVLMFASFLVPGFQVRGFWTAFLTAAVIASIGYILETMLGGEVSPYGRGIIGFVSAAAIIYASKFIVPGIQITIIGALLAALLIGMVDLFLPASARFWRAPED